MRVLTWLILIILGQQYSSLVLFPLFSRQVQLNSWFKGLYLALHMYVCLWIIHNSRSLLLTGYNRNDRKEPDDELLATIG